MQQIVLFIESNSSPYIKNSEIGNKFINRFAIEEDGNSEVLKILELDFRLFDYRDIPLEQGLDHIFSRLQADSI